MRIAIVIDSLARGGAERQALNAVLELTRAGRDVELIYYTDTEVKHVHEAYQRARVTLVPKDRKPVRFIWRLGRYLKSRNFDLVHAFKSTPTAYAYLAARLAGIRTVLGGFRCEYDATGVYYLTDYLVNRVATGWVVNSQATARSVCTAVKAKPEKVFVVYNGIDPQAFRSKLSPAEAKRKLGIEPHRLTTSLIGVMRPQKNHRLFIEAAALALKQAPEACFVLVGDGELRPSLEEYARSFNVGEGIRFLGVRQDIPDVLAATDVAVLTSHYEGVANALLEAMSVGVPVVSTDYAGVEELMTDGREGLIVPQGSAAAVAAAVLRLFGDAALRAQMGGEGRRTVETRFSMEVMAAGLYSVYERCFNGVGRNNEPDESRA